MDESTTWIWEKEQIERKTIYIFNNQPTTIQEHDNEDIIVTLESPTTSTSIHDEEESSLESTPR